MHLCVCVPPGCGRLPILRRCARRSLTEELKKNGAETFPYPQLTEEGEMVDPNEKPPANMPLAEESADREEDVAADDDEEATRSRQSSPPPCLCNCPSLCEALTRRLARAQDFS